MSVYFMQSAGELRATEIMLGATGITVGAESLVSSGPHGHFARLAPDLYTDDTFLLRFSGITPEIIPQSSEVSNGAWLPDAKVQGDALFIGYDVSGEFRVKRLDLAAAGAETAILAEPGVSDYEVVGESLFYAKADGTWRKDLGTGAVEKYADSPVGIEVVR